MTVEEAAKLLFVSRPHVHQLVKRGALSEVLPKRPNDTVNIDPLSAHALLTKREAAQRTYLDSQTEDADPLGLWP
ncbi:helix-turn-helix domain-containing protein [Trinickia sp. EG282A]|uniref:helix-turn-helix domain-containing protein n=1 Tax=Trinickia sp. EG282A TaxID=3237013 RepID=UPI0034D30A5A